MEFALVDNVRTSAAPDLNATCPQCGESVQAKCGQIVVHHWAHLAGTDCDPWSEPETPWHRHWKSFGYRTEQTIQNHRADVVSSSGLIFELQHSGISVEDIQAREACYGSQLRWLFDGTDLVVLDADRNWRYAGSDKDNPYFIKAEENLDGIVEYGEVDSKVVRPRCSLHLSWKNKLFETVDFHWKHPRKTYAACQAPVYIDLHGEHVLKVDELHVLPGFPCRGSGELLLRTAVEEMLR